MRRYVSAASMIGPKKRGNTDLRPNIPLLSYSQRGTAIADAMAPIDVLLPNSTQQIRIRIIYRCRTLKMVDDSHRCPDQRRWIRSHTGLAPAGDDSQPFGKCHIDLLHNGQPNPLNRLRERERMWNGNDGNVIVQCVWIVAMVGDGMAAGLGIAARPQLQGSKAQVELILTVGAVGCG